MFASAVKSENDGLFDRRTTSAARRGIKRLTIKIATPKISVYLDGCTMPASK
jgi:hypothetical protein